MLAREMQKYTDLQLGRITTDDLISEAEAKLRHMTPRPCPDNADLVEVKVEIVDHYARLQQLLEIIRKLWVFQWEIDCNNREKAPSELIFNVVTQEAQ